MAIGLRVGISCQTRFIQGLTKLDPISKVEDYTPARPIKSTHSIKIVVEMAAFSSTRQGIGHPLRVLPL